MPCSYLADMNQLLLQKLITQYRELSLLLDDLPLGFIQKRHQAGKWSILENVAHLGRYQEIFLERLNLMLTRDQPALGRYKAENDPGFEEWTALTLDEVWKRLESGRQVLVDLFKRLSAIACQRTGEHPILGVLTIAEWLHFFLLHESHHLYTIFKIRHTYRS